MDGKDAFASVTNWSLIAGGISAVLAANGIIVDVATVTAILSVVVGMFGRWRAGGIKSVVGLPVPQPK
jgi:hypothetical protein